MGRTSKKYSTFLEHKTTAGCIEFYYKNQKSECFEEIKKKLKLRKQGRSFTTDTYMVTSGKKWDYEANAASVDMLGAASVIAAHADESLKTHWTCDRKLSLGRYHSALKHLRVMMLSLKGQTLLIFLE